MKKIILILITIFTISALTSCDSGVSKLSVYEDWLLNTEIEEIKKIKITKEPLLLGDFLCAEYFYTTEIEEIERVFGVYKSLKMRKVESFEQNPGSTNIMVEFYYSDDIVTSIHIIDQYYSYNDEHFKLNSVPEIKEEACTKHTYTINSYMSVHNVYQYIYGDEVTTELFATISRLNYIEFEKYTGDDLPENEFIYYIDTEFGRINILTQNIFYLGDEVYQLTENKSFNDYFLSL